MDIMGGLAAAGQALDIVKKLSDMEKEFDRAEFKLRIAELTVALADTKIALSEARVTLAERESEIQLLKSSQTDRMPTVSYRGYSFGVDAGASIGRPFCPICEKTKRMQVQIQRATSTKDFCPSCKAVYGQDYPWHLPNGFDVSGAK